MENNEMIGSIKDFDTAVYSLWFGLNYGSILTAFALYKTLEQFGKRPALLPKPEKLWTEHYAEKDNIAGMFIYENCCVLDMNDEAAKTRLSDPDTTHVAGADLVWSRDLVGEFTDYFMLSGAANEQRKLSVGSSFGREFGLRKGLDNEFYHFLRRLDFISVADKYNADAVKQYFDLNAHELLDPVFLCEKQEFIDCAEKSAAKKNERTNSFVFVSVENGDKRKRDYVLRGNNIMLRNKGSFLRCMIDINRFPESKKALGMEPAFYIRVEDYLYYLINAEFVLTDNVYAMYMALVFEKPFAVLANEDDPDLYRFEEFLKPLGLSERIVILQDDFNTREYLFRKPVNYSRVTPVLAQRRENDLSLLRNALGITEVNE